MADETKNKLADTQVESIWLDTELVGVDYAEAEARLMAADPDMVRAQVKADTYARLYGQRPKPAAQTVAVAPPKSERDIFESMIASVKEWSRNLDTPYVGLDLAMQPDEWAFFPKNVNSRCTLEIEIQRREEIRAAREAQNKKYEALKAEWAQRIGVPVLVIVRPDTSYRKVPPRILAQAGQEKIVSAELNSDGGILLIPRQKGVSATLSIKDVEFLREATGEDIQRVRVMEKPRRRLELGD